MMNSLFSPRVIIIQCLMISILWSSIDAQQPSRFDKLKELQRKSTILDFTDDSIQGYTTQVSNYTIVLLMATTNIQVPGADLAKVATQQFSIVANSYLQSLGSEQLDSPTFLKDPIFFARCELEKCRETFREGGSKAGWRAIPKLFVIRPRSVKGGVDVTKWVDMSGDPVSADAFGIAKWIKEVTGYSFTVQVSFFDRYSNDLITVFLLGVVIYGLYPRLKVLVQIRLFWFAVGMGVYCFSMAGVVFNAIHNPPWNYVHPQNKQVMYIYPSARQQFVAEGLILAALLGGLGLVVLGFGAWIPSLKDNSKRRVGFAVLSIMFFFLYQQLMTIFRSKYGWYPF